jgi:hypothetical protein
VRAGEDARAARAQNSSDHRRARALRHSRVGPTWSAPSPSLSSHAGEYRSAHGSQRLVRTNLDEPALHVRVVDMACGFHLEATPPSGAPPPSWTARNRARYNGGRPAGVCCGHEGGLKPALRPPYPLFPTERPWLRLHAAIHRAPLSG